MELDEIKEFRKKIFEIILNSEELKDITLTQKKSFNDLKKDCYDKLIDLKTDFDSEKEKDKKDSIKKIDSLISSLGKLKTFLSSAL